MNGKVVQEVIPRLVDGWFGVLYRDGREHRIATRGSFHSTGAVWATEFLKRYDLTDLPDEVTLLFEIICPTTHIVVNYGDHEDLVLLAAYNRKTGEEYEWEQIEIWTEQFGFTLVKSYEQGWLGYCRGQIKQVPGDELEGYVIRFNNGLRVKIKSEDYFRRSHLLMNLTPLVIWDTMVYGKVPEDVWNMVDLDYHDLLKRIADELESKYSDIELEITKQFYSIEEHENRAIFARQAVKKSHVPAMFAEFDGQDKRVDAYIMKRIRPHGNVIQGEDV